jgi:hypothetical protein
MPFKKKMIDFNQPFHYACSHVPFGVGKRKIHPFNRFYPYPVIISFTIPFITIEENHRPLLKQDYIKLEEGTINVLQSETNWLIAVWTHLHNGYFCF